MSEIKSKAVVNVDGTISFNRSQDVEDILEQNKAEFNDSDQNNKAAIRKVATIPNIIIERWMKEGINLYNMGRDPDVRKAVLKKLNSPEYRYLRTHNSRL